MYYYCCKISVEITNDAIMINSLLHALTCNVQFTEQHLQFSVDMTITGDLIPGSRPAHAKKTADFALLKNHDENSKKAETGKNTKN